MPRIDIYHHILPSVEVSVRMDAFDRKLDLINRRLEKIMATLQDVLDNEESESTQITVIQQIIENLRQQLADILSGANLPPAVQAQVDAVFAKSTANKASLDAMSAPVTPTP
jgi:predicted  nucleic acid-binding Zn-ribbon protein